MHPSMYPELLRLHHDEIERRARDSDCIATVGRIEVQPGAINVIPGRADISLDLRAATDGRA